MVQAQHNPGPGTGLCRAPLARHRQHQCRTGWDRAGLNFKPQNRDLSFPCGCHAGSTAINSRRERHIVEAVKSGHSFSSTCLIKIDTKLTIFSDVTTGRAGIHKHSSLRGTGPRSSGMRHLFLAVMWFAHSEDWLEWGLGGGCVCLFGGKEVLWDFGAGHFSPCLHPHLGIAAVSCDVQNPDRD